MRTVGVMCGSGRRAAPVEMVLRRVCAQTRHGCSVVRILNPSDVARCDRVVLAPTGTLASATAELSSGLGQALTDLKNAGKPCLGISLGMVLMVAPEALRWFQGACLPVPATPQPMTGAPAKVPHVGWNRLMLEPACHPVMAAAGRSGTWMYFCHDVHAVPADPTVVSATIEAGATRLVAGIQRGNVLGTLFHPERSHRAGTRLLVAFLDHG